MRLAPFFVAVVLRVEVHGRADIADAATALNRLRINISLAADFDIFPRLNRGGPLQTAGTGCGKTRLQGRPGDLSPAQPSGGLWA